MNKELIEQATTATANLDELSAKEFGSPVVAKELVVPTVNDEGLQVIKGHELLPQAALVPLGVNFDALTRRINKGFGILMVVDGVRKLYPCVITSRTAADSLSVTYLPDNIVLPKDSDQNIDDNGEDRTLSEVQKKVLSGARGIQDRRVGTEHSHSTVAKAVTEIGHTAMALRALTDEETMYGIGTGVHVVHEWSEDQHGIASKLTQRDEDKPGVFDIQTTNGPRNISLPTLELKQNTPDVVLVSHSAFELPEVVETKIMIGLGLVAAKQYYGSETALQDRMLRTMERIH